MTDEEIHAKRKKNNLMLGGVLVLFVALVFGITVVKMTNGHNMEGYDHVRRPALEEIK